MTTPSNISVKQCNDDIDTDYEIISTCINITLFLFGVMYTFFGYRCFKAVMFLSGVIFATTAVYLVCSEERIFEQETSVEMAAGIAIGIGVLCGFITMLVRYVGLFLQGFFLGSLAAIGVMTILHDYYNPSSLWVTFSILFVAGVVFSFLTLKFERWLIIIGTSFLGAALIVTCIDYFLEKFHLLIYVWEELMDSSSEQLCWYSWVVFAVWPALSVLGIIIQYKVTGKNYDHTDVILLQGRRKRVRTHLIRQQRGSPNNQQAPQRSSQQPPRRSGRYNNSNLVVNRSSTIQIRVESEPSNNRLINESNTPPPSYEECVESGIVQSSSSNNALLRNQDNRRSSRSRYSQTEETMQANENANRRKLQPKSRKSVAQQTAGSSRSPASGEVFSPGETRPILAPNERRSNNGVLMRKPPRVEVIAAHAERLLAADRRKKLQRSSKPLSNQS